MARVFGCMDNKRCTSEKGILICLENEKLYCSLTLSLSLSAKDVVERKEKPQKEANLFA